MVVKRISFLSPISVKRCVFFVISFRSLAPVRVLFVNKCSTQSDEEDVNRKNAFSKSFQNIFLLCPWSVKLAIRKYSAAGPYYFRFFPLWSPPWNFYSPFGTPKGARKIIGPRCRIFSNGPFCTPWTQ